MGNAAHDSGIGFEGLAAFAGQLADGERIFAFEGFGDGQVASFLELGEVAGEIALGEAAFPLEVDKVGFFHSKENGHDHQPCGLVDHTVEGRKTLDAVATHDSVGFGLGLTRK